MLGIVLGIGFVASILAVAGVWGAMMMIWDISKPDFCIGAFGTICALFMAFLVAVKFDR
jgi:hypothetical protein